MIIGSDPEFFLFNGKNPIPSVHVLGQSDAPIIIDGVVFYVDNAAVETNIDPSSTVSELISNIKKCVDVIGEFVDTHGAKISYLPYVEFSERYIAEPTLHIFGCLPDYCSHTMSKNEICSLPTLGRSTGGHIHINLEDTSKEAVINQVMLLDLYVGVSMAVAEGKVGLKRRSTYGKAGCFRYKDYGLEYRTPSSMWLKNNDSIKDTWSMVERAIRMAGEGQRLEREDLDAIVGAINRLDQQSIDYIKSKYKI